MANKIKIKDLRHEISLHYGKKFPNNDAVKDGIYPVITSARISPYNHNECNQVDPCVTVSISGTPGIVLFHNSPIWAGNCIVITSKIHNIKYIYYALKHMEPQIKGLQSGGVISHVYIKEIERIAIPVPSLSEQNKIVELLDKLEDGAKKLLQMQDLYEMFKKGLMQEKFD